MKTLVYASVALIAAAAGFIIFRVGIAPRIVEDAAPPTAIASTPSSPAAQDSATEMPTRLPEFVLTDREGTPRSIRSWPGKSMIVNFWATWCAPCRREIPLLKQIQAKRGTEGFQVVGIAVDFREDVLEYADEMEINYPLLIGEQDGLDAIAEFGLAAAGFPFTVFTDAQSHIIVTHLGEVTPKESDVLLDIIAQVNRGELTPDAARVVAAKQLAQLDRDSPEA
jgi:thiol-disulfide isomerase/thioredoxin